MSGDPQAAPDLSVVVPVYRTAWALPELARRVRETVASEGLSHELILVDDASPDDARVAAAGLAAIDPAVRYVPMEKNVGQHRAVLAGLAAARGAWTAVMDGDLQDPPEAIPRLLERAREGYDAVFAARVGRYQSRGRMVTSRLFKRALARVAGVPPGSGMYFLASRRMVERIVACDDPRPFVVALVGLAGLPVSSVPVERAERGHGGSAYSGRRRLAAGLSALAFAWRRRRRPARPGPGTPPAALETPWPALATVGVAAGALAVVRVVLMSRGQPFGLGDEGFRYLLSRSWADGVSLFDAFRLQYVPGQYVYFGSFLCALGPELATLRLAGALLGGAAVAVLTVALGRLARLPLTVVAGGALALLALPDHATLASALVLVLALDLAHRRVVGPGWVFWTTAAAGGLAGWREDSAVLLLVVALVAVALRRRPRDLVLLVLPGAVLGFAPWLLAFAGRGEAEDLLAHVARRLFFLVERLGEPTRPGWRFPDRPLASPRHLATALFPALAATPPAVYLGVLVREGLRFRRTGEVRWPVAAAAMVGCAYLPQFLWERPDLSHLQAHLHLLVTVAAVAAGTLRRRPRRLALAGLAVLAVAGAARATVLAVGDRPALYPCCEGRRIGARLPAPPPWAGLASANSASASFARGDGELVVLGWGPGWYVLEGAAPATRFLYTGERSLDAAAAAELAADLAGPAVRGVLVQDGVTPYPEPLRVVEDLYEPREAWRGWRLWERSSGGSGPPG